MCPALGTRRNALLSSDGSAHFSIIFQLSYTVYIDEVLQIVNPALCIKKPKPACMSLKGTRGRSSTSSTKGSCPARRARTGSAHVVAGSSVPALTAVLTARAKASLGASCGGGITTR